MIFFFYISSFLFSFLHFSLLFSSRVLSCLSSYMSLFLFLFFSFSSSLFLFSLSLSLFLYVGVQCVGLVVGVDVGFDM